MTSFNTVKTYISFYHNGTEWKAILSDDPNAGLNEKWCIEIPVPSELTHKKLDKVIDLGEKIVNKPNWVKMNMEG